MADKLFDTTAIGDFLSTITVATSQRAASEKRTAEVAAREAEIQNQESADYNDAAAKALDKLKVIEAQGAEASRMAEGNLFDRISLIGDQILNPRAFTREGRQGQLAETAQELTLKGQIYSIGVNASQARLAKRQADAVLEMADTEAGLAKLKAHIDGLALASQAITQTETLRATTLAQADLPTIQKALVGPTPPGGKVMINGFAFTPLELKERANNLETRELVAALGPQVADPEYAGKLRAQHNLALATYTLPELEELKNRGYIMPDGTQVEPQVFDIAYNRATTYQAEALQKMLTQNTIENQLPVLLTEGQKMLDNGAKYATPGTPLALARAQYQAALQTTATAASAAGVTPEKKALQMDNLAKAQESYGKAVKAEALRKAAGDEELSKIYEDQILGVPLSPARVQDVVVSRFKKGKGFGDFLPNGTALRLQKFADQELSQLQKENAQAGIIGGDKKSDSELREDAIRRAFDRVSGDAGVNGMNLIQAASVKRTDNPAIQAGMVPGQIMELQRRASEIATSSVAKSENLAPEQIEAIRGGRFADAGMDPTKAAMIAQRINIESIATEYELLDAQKTGLGYAMQQWYVKTLPEMAQNYTAALEPTEAALVGDSVLDQVSKFSDLYTAVDESAVSRGAEIAAAKAIGAKKPVNMWPVLLEMDDRLADSQKQQILHEIILPIIQQSAAAGRDDAATSQAITEALGSFQSPDPMLASAVKTLSRSLPRSLDMFDKTWKVIASQGLEVQNPGDAWTLGTRIRKNENDFTAAYEQIRKVLPWVARTGALPSRTAQ